MKNKNFVKIFQYVQIEWNQKLCVCNQKAQ